MGEINSNLHKTLGCLGTITDGCIRDVDEMTNAGFKAMARNFCVGHAYSTPVRWGCELEVFGTIVKPGDLIHADKHGFICIDPEDCDHLLEAVQFMDENECNNLLSLSRNARELTPQKFVEEYNLRIEAFQKDAKNFFDNLKKSIAHE